MKSGEMGIYGDRALHCRAAWHWRAAWHARAALVFVLLNYAGPGATARALQILEAADHAELSAEISGEEVNRIALDGDRISRVIQSPGGFTVEHDPVRGDLYLYPDRAVALGPMQAREAATPVTLYVGTEEGFTYRLTLSVVSRESAQILIRNAAAAAPDAWSSNAAAPSVAGYQNELVTLIRAVARRESLPGYIRVVAPEPPQPGSTAEIPPAQQSFVELWRGPRFTARVLRIPAEGVADAEQLAKLAGSDVAAVWLSAPGRGSGGGRLAVVVEANPGSETAR